ncbi:hypothetical protein ACLMJK_001886 [Lecanora helva]
MALIPFLLLWFLDWFNTFLAKKSVLDIVCFAVWSAVFFVVLRVGPKKFIYTLAKELFSMCLEVPLEMEEYLCEGRAACVATSHGLIAVVKFGSRLPLALFNLALLAFKFTSRLLSAILQLVAGLCFLSMLAISTYVDSIYERIHLLSTPTLPSKEEVEANRLAFIARQLKGKKAVIRQQRADKAALNGLVRTLQSESLRKDREIASLDASYRIQQEAFEEQCNELESKGTELESKNQALVSLKDEKDKFEWDLDRARSNLFVANLRLTNLSKQVKRKPHKLEKAEDEISTLRDQLSNATRDLTAAENREERSLGEVDELKRSLKDVKSQRDSLRQDLEKLQRAAAAQSDTSYKDSATQTSAQSHNSYQDSATQTFAQRHTSHLDSATQTSGLASSSVAASKTPSQSNSSVSEQRAMQDQHQSTRSDSSKVATPSIFSMSVNHGFAKDSNQTFTSAPKPTKQVRSGGPPKRTPNVEMQSPFAKFTNVRFGKDPGLEKEKKATSNVFSPASSTSPRSTSSAAAAPAIRAPTSSSFDFAYSESRAPTAPSVDFTPPASKASTARSAPSAPSSGFTFTASNPLTNTFPPASSTSPRSTSSAAATAPVISAPTSSSFDFAYSESRAPTAPSVDFTPPASKASTAPSAPSSGFTFTASNPLADTFSPVSFARPLSSSSVCTPTATSLLPAEISSSNDDVDMQQDGENFNTTEEEARRVEDEIAMDTELYEHENANTQGQVPLAQPTISVSMDPLDSDMPDAELPSGEPLPSSAMEITDREDTSMTEGGTMATMEPQPTTVGSPALDFSSGSRPGAQVAQSIDQVTTDPQPANVASPTLEVSRPDAQVTQSTDQVTTDPQPANVGNPESEFSGDSRVGAQVTQSTDRVIMDPQPANVASPTSEVSRPDVQVTQSTDQVTTGPQPANVASPTLEVSRPDAQVTQSTYQVTTDPQPANIGSPRSELSGDARPGAQVTESTEQNPTGRTIGGEMKPLRRRKQKTDEDCLRIPARKPKRVPKATQEPLSSPNRDDAGTNPGFPLIPARPAPTSQPIDYKDAFPVMKEARDAPWLDINMRPS